ncbi:uncharacterized protein LOC113506094 [Trichoplusia ni]|uniref:Uncharacterized protein LOC113506094 n=1 Tax=Trichoplusia ni TaxID=7111 RepID=A0A7E5WW45_TRINI|nr:uncharacterized protein LOC113506094 [Trichoplusia ni]
MEEVLKALQNIQKELDEQKITIQKSGENVTEQVTQNINNILDEKFKSLEEKYENLKDKVDNQEKRIYFLEKQARQRNIVLFGLKETESSYSSLENIIINFINEHFSIKIDQRDIQEAKRIGKKGERPRPIIITVSTLGIKIAIFKQKKVLEDTPYYIKEDYPEYVLNKRKELQEQVRIEKEKGNSVRIKYDKIIIMNKHSNHTSNYSKRMLSNSPESITTCTNPSDEHKTQANKKNKTEAPIQRSSSLSEGPVKPGILNFFHKHPTNTSKNQENKTNNI